MLINSPAFNHHGQICFSTERIIVLRKVAESFISLLKQKALQWPDSHGVDARIVKASYDMLIDAQNKGASFLLGKPEYRTATSLAPAILTGVTSKMRIWDDESFGPSSTVIVVEDQHQAIRVVNESNYGLDAILFTKDMRKAIEIAQELQVGRVRVNSVAHECKLERHGCITITNSALSDFSDEPRQRKRIWSQQQSLWD
jgi:acyl-CoA reductase-like NAD-dependent aldehyde dehydrogenase